jgi:hypothetical protein
VGGEENIHPGIRDRGNARQVAHPLSLYERFEQTVVAVLTLIIAVIIAIATWQLLVYTLKLARSHVANPGDPQAVR